MNAGSHCNRPRASSSAMIARQIRSHVPSSSQRFSRRQHVEGLGYSTGRSRQRAPVFSTQRMPSTPARWLAQGRPPRWDRGIRGRSGSILAHCASVKRTLRKQSTRAKSTPQGVMKPLLGISFTRARSGPAVESATNVVTSRASSKAVGGIAPSSVSSIATQRSRRPSRCGAAKTTSLD